MSISRSTRHLAWPTLAYLAVFFLAPTAIVVSYSFLTRDFYGQVIHKVSLDGWRQAVDATTWKLLGRSIALSSLVTLGTAVFGYPWPIACSRLGPGKRRLCVALLAFPLMTSLLLRIYGWMNVLPVSWRGNLPMVGVVMMVNSLPFMVLPLLRACERIDPTLEDASLDLGATPWETFWRVTWPLTRPGLWAGCALVFIPCAGEYLVPHFIGEGKVDVLGTEIVKQFMEPRNWPYAAACAVWLLLLVLVPALFSARRSDEAAAHVGRQRKESDAR